MMTITTETMVLVAPYDKGISVVPLDTEAFITRWDDGSKSLHWQGSKEFYLQ